jgi:hypothetical protein
MLIALQPSSWRRKSADESISADSGCYRGCYYGASPAPAPQFRVCADKGIITLKAVNNGKVLGKPTFERLGVVSPTQDELRHMALDVTAAVVAGNGAGNTRSVLVFGFTLWLRKTKRHM